MLRELEYILKEQTRIVRTILSQSTETDSATELAFDFPNLLDFVAVSILIPIWTNLLAAGMYEWTKGELLSIKEQDELLSRLRQIQNETNPPINLDFFDDVNCVERVNEVLEEAGVSKEDRTSLAIAIIEAVKESTLKEDNS